METLEPVRQPRVTVGIVTFRHVDYVRRALDSTLAQENCAVVVADDASDDGTQDVIREWHAGLDAGQRGRVTLLLSTTNQGLTPTLNLVLENVRTPYFAYLAGDDWHLEDRLRRQADHLEATGADLSYGDALRADSAGVLHSRSFYERHPGWAEKIGTSDPLATFLTSGNWIAAPTVMLRTEALHRIGGFDEQIAYEDFDCYTRIAARGDIAYLEGPPLAVHRELDSSLGSDLFREDSVRWIEGQARTELKMLGERPELDRSLAAKIFHRVVRSADLGADPQWVARSLHVVRPYLTGRARLSWVRHRVRAAERRRRLNA